MTTSSQLPLLGGNRCGQLTLSFRYWGGTTVTTSSQFSLLGGNGFDTFPSVTANGEGTAVITFLSYFYWEGNGCDTFPLPFLECGRVNTFKAAKKNYAR